MWESGPVRLVQAGGDTGAKVSGTIDAGIGNLAWEDFDLGQLKRAP